LLPHYPHFLYQSIHELTKPIMATIAATGHGITNLWVLKTFLLLITPVTEKIQDTPLYIIWVL